MNEIQENIKSCPKFFRIPENWSYRGEGNSSLVISLPDSGKVVHIKKVEKGFTLVHWISDWLSYVVALIVLIVSWLLSRNFISTSLNVRFYMEIMRPLLGKEYVSEVREVLLSPIGTRKLEEKLADLRPAHRKHKILKPGRATILDDFALLPNSYSPLEMVEDSFAIEIKPKQGWIPLSMKLFPKCIYCMNQYYKLEKGDIKYISSYCPEDFFSGNDVLMIKAIKGLIENPQNNFRIFKNGKLVYGENFKYDQFSKIIRDIFDNQIENWLYLREEFCSLLKQSLTTRSNNFISNCCCSRKLYCEWDTSIRNKYKLLFKGSVLERILSVQMLDVEGCAYYESLLNEKTLGCGVHYVEKLLKDIRKVDQDVCIKCALMLLSNVNEGSKGEIDTRCIPYLMSSIANDCSLMVTFRKVKRDIDNRGLSENILCTKYGNFAVRIGVFDLFPKPASIIRKHINRNNRIFKAYVENLSLPQRMKLSGCWQLLTAYQDCHQDCYNSRNFFGRVLYSLKYFSRTFVVDKTKYE